MHFPDSVLSPSTCAVAGAAILPVFGIAGKRLRETLGTRQVPLLSLGAAFCFTIMMFNMPAFGGTTAHPVAGTLLAVLLGPWAAVIGVSVALLIQALFFGDGGLLAYGANCFVMAFVLPFVGYSVYALLARRLPPQAPLRAVYAGVGAYVGLNAAAIVVAILLGIQPTLFHEANGHALYFPLGLKVTLPAMLLTHLLIAGPAEAIVTALVVRYAQQSSLPLYGVQSGLPSAGDRRERLWIALLAIIALTPLGLLAGGEAWGEWDKAKIAEQIKQVEGQAYTPKGLEAAEEKSHKGISGLEDYAGEQGAKGYVFAALLGTGSIAGLLRLSGKLLVKPDKEENDTPPPPPQEGTSSNPPNGSPEASGLPDWLQKSSDTTRLPENTGGKANPFLERSLSELTTTTAAALNSERWSQQPGLLQQMDSRAKLLALFALLLTAASVRTLFPLLLLYGFTFALGLASRLPMGAVTKRVWLSAPLFVGTVAFPAVLNIVTPGQPLVILSHAPLLAVTEPGLYRFFVLLLRVAVAVSAAALLTRTTRWSDLLRAMRTFGTPRLFVMTLAMTYRYLTSLMQTASEMFLARRSRTVGRLTNTEGRRYIGLSIGALFGKTLALSEEVHAAMLARGYTGESPALLRPHWRPADSLFTAAVALTAIFALLWR